MPLKGGQLGDVQVAAYLAALVEDYGLEAALLERDGGLHTGGAGADYGHDAPVAVHLERTLGALAQGVGVDGAVGLVAGEEADVEAVHAGDAVAQLVLAAFLTFFDPLALGEDTAAHADHVAVAVGNNLVDEIRMADAAGRHDGDADRLLYKLRRWHLPAFGAVDVPGHDVVLVVDRPAGRYCDHIRTGGLNQRGNLCALLRRDAVLTVRPLARRVVKALHFDGDDAVGADRGPDAADGLCGKARAVFDRFPAVLIRAVVEKRGNKLAGKVAVAGLELNSVRARGHRTLCGSYKLVLYGVYLVHGKLVHGLGLNTGIIGRAGMPELEKYLCAVLVRGGGETAEAGDEPVVVYAGLQRQNARPLVVDDHCTGNNDAHTAGGDGLYVLYVARGYGIVKVGDGFCHCQVNDTVFDGLASHLYRFKKLVAHCSSSSHKHGLAAGADAYLAYIYAPGLVHDVNNIVSQHLRAKVEAVYALTVVAPRSAKPGESVDDLAVYA